jgi:hypothetical protein
MARFKNIDKADQFKADKIKVDAWRAKSSAEKQVAFKATQAVTKNLKTAVEYTLGYIVPFGTVLTQKIFLVVNKPKSGTAVVGKTETDADLFADIETLLGARITGTKPSGVGNYLIDVRGVRGFDPARAIFSKKGDPVEGVKSRMTDRAYSYVKKSSVSSPMGQTEGQTSYNTSIQAMIDALNASTALVANHSLSFKEEKGVKISVTAA